MKIIAIDIGGTDIKFGLIDQTGIILQKGIVSTGKENTIENLLDKLSKIIEKYLDKDIVGIGISSTGQVDSKEGKIIGGTDIVKHLINKELVSVLKEKYKLPVIMENDVNCAALGEFWMGGAKGEKDFICLTIGTGIGGAIVLNGEVYTGSNGVAGEFGHIQIESNGRKCGCGKNGCYEAYGSTSSLVRLVNETTGESLNGKIIFEKIHNNEKIYVDIYEKWCDYIAQGLSIIINIFNPKLILIGGGVSAQGDFLLNSLKKHLENKIGENYKKGLELKVTKTGNDAGILGAAYLLLKKEGLI